MAPRRPPLRRPRLPRPTSQPVEETAATLLGQAARSWTVDEPWSDRHLRWASRLHDVGIAISHSGHHKHGAYLVHHSDLAGFSRDSSRPPVVLEAKKERLRLHFPTGWLDQHPLTRTALEEEARDLSAIDYRLSLHGAGEAD